MVVEYISWKALVISNYLLDIWRKVMLLIWYFTWLNLVTKLEVIKCQVQFHDQKILMKVWFNLVNSRSNFLIWRCLKHKKNITHRNNDSLPMYSIFIHWNRNAVIFTKFASLGAASGENFIKIMTYLNVGELRKGKFTNITCHFGVTLDVDMPWKLSVSLALCAQHNRSIIYIYMYVCMYRWLGARLQ